MGQGSDQMAPSPFTCDALLDDGSKCSEKVMVTKTNYVYDRRPIVSEPATYSLRETHYHAICPKCGDREFIEAVVGPSA